MAGRYSSHSRMAGDLAPAYTSPYSGYGESAYDYPEYGYGSSYGGYRGGYSRGGYPRSYTPSYTSPYDYPSPYGSYSEYSSGYGGGLERYSGVVSPAYSSEYGGYGASRGRSRVIGRRVVSKSASPVSRYDGMYDDLPTGGYAASMVRAPTYVSGGMYDSYGSSYLGGAPTYVAPSAGYLGGSGYYGGARSYGSRYSGSGSVYGRSYVSGGYSGASVYKAGYPKMYGGGGYLSSLGSTTTLGSAATDVSVSGAALPTTTTTTIPSFEGYLGFTGATGLTGFDGYSIPEYGSTISTTGFPSTTTVPASTSVPATSDDLQSLFRTQHSYLFNPDGSMKEGDALAAALKSYNDMLAAGMSSEDAALALSGQALTAAAPAAPAAEQPEVPAESAAPAADAPAPAPAAELPPATLPPATMPPAAAPAAAPAPAPAAPAAPAAAVPAAAPGAPYVLSCVRIRAP